MKLTTMLQDVVSDHGDRIALVTPTERVTFEQLDDRARRAAAILAAHQVFPGDRIGIMSVNSPAAVYTLFGAWYLGAVAVPLDPKLDSDKLEAVISHAGIEVALISSNFWKAAKRVDLGIEWIVSDPSRGAGSAGADSRPGAAGGQGSRSDASLFETTLEVVEPYTEAEYEDAATALLQYGEFVDDLPRGSVFTHAEIVRAQPVTAQAMGIDEYDVVQTVSPLWEAAALHTSILTPLSLGAGIVLGGLTQPAGVAALVQKTGSTVVTGYEGALLATLPGATMAGFAPGDIERIFVLGPVSSPRVGAEIARAYKAKQFFGFYSPDVTAGVGLIISAQDVVKDPGSIGTTEHGTGIEVRVSEEPFEGAGSTDGEDASVGELQLQGPGLMKNFWRNPVATAASFEGEWLRTGIPAHIDESGHIRLV